MTRKRTYVEWTPQMLEKLRIEYPTAISRELAKELGVTTAALQAQAHREELKKFKGPSPWWDNRQFPRGAEVANHLPIGNTQVLNGHLFKKVCDEGPSFKKWQSVARLVWEEKNGPVPPKHVVRFKDGQHTTVEEEITIDKVECISMSENMRRNSRHNYGPEVNELFALQAALTRKLNSRKKLMEEGT